MPYYISPLIFFLYFLKVSSFTFPQQALKSLSWVTLDFALKIAHRGKRKLICLSKKWICCAYLRFFLCFLVYGIKPILSSHHQSFLRFLKRKILTCNCSFSELTSHTTKEISSASCPVFCRMYPSPWKSAVFLCGILCAWPEVDRLYHSCTLGCWKDA